MWTKESWCELWVITDPKILSYYKMGRTCPSCKHSITCDLTSHVERKTVTPGSITTLYGWSWIHNLKRMNPSSLSWAPSRWGLLVFIHCITETHVYNSFGAETLAVQEKDSVFAILRADCGGSSAREESCPLWRVYQPEPPQIQGSTACHEQQVQDALGRASQVVTIGFTCLTFYPRSHM